MSKKFKNQLRDLLGHFYDTLMLPKHWLIALLANMKRNWPARNLKVIGVTGTNGKTSTCFLIHAMLVKAGYKTGLMTTVASGYQNDLKAPKKHMTSQPIYITLDQIKKMRKKKLDWLVLEVTSQALAQFRTMGIPISIAVMTNVTHEHLDYHRTFERYLKAKLKLFRQANRNRKGKRLGVINANDPSALVFAHFIANIASYSITSDTDKTIARPKGLKLTPLGSQYTLNIQDDSYDITCNLPGRFNVENSLAAALVGRAIGLKKKEIEGGIASLQQVEGRMTSIDAGQPFYVLVDFAHSPDSFTKLFEDMRPLIKGKLIVMFGSPGRRDVAKRAIQGKIAGEYADVIILTEDDPRDEDSLAICQQIAKGAVKAGKVIEQDLFIVNNRKEAIKTAISYAKTKDDAVFLLSKGHEKTILRGSREDPWDEVGIAQEILKAQFKAKS